MTNDPNDIVRVAAGDLVRIELYQQALKAARVESRVVGEDLGASLGTMLPQSVELWVHRSDAGKAAAAIARADAEHGRPPHEPAPHGRPANDPKPDRPDARPPHTHYDPDPRS